MWIPWYLLVGLLPLLLSPDSPKRSLDLSRVKVLPDLDLPVLVMVTGPGLRR